MSVRIVSFEAAVKAAIQSQLAGNLDDAAAHYEDRLKAAIGIQGPPRSSPGNPPHMDTGALHDSIDHQVDAASLTARIGSDVEYAATLELTTNRPAWIPTLLAEADAIARLIARP